MIISPPDKDICRKNLIAVHDALDVLNGKWKIHVLASLTFKKKKFSDLQRDIRGISNKILSRQLKEMEMSRLVSRTVSDSQKNTFDYSLTEFGYSLRPVIESLTAWGTEYRTKMLGKSR